MILLYVLETNSSTDEVIFIRSHRSGLKIDNKQYNIDEHYSNNLSVVHSYKKTNPTPRKKTMTNQGIKD